jgi:hypothetical protein
MEKEKRKARRRPLRYSAWIALDDDILQGCALSDISDLGARIDVEDSKALPDSFCLMLSGRGSARRECRVIWRKETQVGVAFEKPLSQEAALAIGKKPAAKDKAEPEPAA